MGVVLFIIIGIAAGFLATRAMRLETDVLTTIVIGVAGAVFGGILIRAFLTMAGWMAGLVGAILGAMLLILLWKSYGR